MTDNLVDQKFGRLTVVSFAGSSNQRRTWNCICDCGRNKTSTTYYLKSGRVNSCGCLQAEQRRKNLSSSLIHGLHLSPEYKCWQGMKQRCENKNDSNYKNYGGRGVFVCKRWQTFQNFYKDMGARPLGSSLDRIDVNGPYNKSNCRWATPQEQMRNRRVSLKPSVYRLIELIMDYEAVSYSTAYKQLRRVAACLNKQKQ